MDNVDRTYAREAGATEHAESAEDAERSENEGDADEDSSMAHDTPFPGRGNVVTDSGKRTDLM